MKADDERNLLIFSYRKSDKYFIIKLDIGEDAFSNCVKVQIDGRPLDLLI